MGLFSMGEKNTSVTETNNYDQSQNTDQSIGAGQGANAVAIGAGGTQINYDPAAATAALAAMTTGNTAAVNAMRDNNTLNAWLQLFGLQSGLGAMGTTASEAIGSNERISGHAMDTAYDVAELGTGLAAKVLDNEGKLVAANADTAKQAFLSAQSLGNNAQNLGLGIASAATNLGANAFGAATTLGAQANATALGMSVRNAAMLEALGAGAFKLSGDVAHEATATAADTVAKVTALADSSQSRMADLVTATEDYNTDLAKTAATGGAADLMKTILWIAVAGAAAYVLRRGK